MVLNALSVLGEANTQVPLFEKGFPFMSVGSIFMKMRESVQEPIPGELCGTHPYVLPELSGKFKPCIYAGP